MNLTCIWFVYQIAQNKCDKRIDIAAFLALKQIVDCSHPYSKYSVCIVMHSLLFSISIYNAAVKKMVTQESKISGPRSHSWHCEYRAKGNGNKHCKRVSHMVRMTLLYDLSASRLLLSDLPLPSINLMIWQRARLIKLNYFCSHLRLTVIQRGPSTSRFKTGHTLVLGCWVTVGTFIGRINNFQGFIYRWE